MIQGLNFPISLVVMFLVNNYAVCILIALQDFSLLQHPLKFPFYNSFLKYDTSLNSTHSVLFQIAL